MFYKICNLFLQKFLIKVCKVQVVLIKRLQREAPKCFRATQIRIINMASEQLSFKMEESVQWHYVLLFYYREASSQIAKSTSKKIETMHRSSIRWWECKILLANPTFLLSLLYIYSNKSFRCDWISECELILWQAFLHSLMKLCETLPQEEMPWVNTYRFPVINYRYNKLHHRC